MGQSRQEEEGIKQPCRWLEKGQACPGATWPRLDGRILQLLPAAGDMGTGTGRPPLVRQGAWHCPSPYPGSGEGATCCSSSRDLDKSPAQARSRLGLEGKTCPAALCPFPHEGHVQSRKEEAITAERVRWGPLLLLDASLQLASPIPHQEPGQGMKDRVQH